MNPGSIFIWVIARNGRFKSNRFRFEFRLANLGLGLAIVHSRSCEAEDKALCSHVDADPLRMVFYGLRSSGSDVRFARMRDRS